MNQRKVWMSSPHRGGSRVSSSLQEETRRRVLAHANANYAGRFERIDVRFRGALCYVDAYVEPERPTKALLRLRGETKEDYYRQFRETPIHLCRLRYFSGRKLWSVAFYTYSHERYEPTLYASGEVYGTPEDAFDLAAIYLT